MIIYEGKGNLLDLECQTTVCTVNCVRVMGKGIALDMRNAIPGLQDFYNRLCTRNHLKPGDIAIYPVPNTDRQILIFATKLHWKHSSNYQWIAEGLKSIALRYKELGITELGLCPLGCGCGSLNFEIVREQIHYELGVKHPLRTKIYC